MIVKISFDFVIKAQQRLHHTWTWVEHEWHILKKDPPQPAGPASPCWTSQSNPIADFFLPGPSFIWNLSDSWYKCVCFMSHNVYESLLFKNSLKTFKMRAGLNTDCVVSLFVVFYFFSPIGKDAVFKSLMISTDLETRAGLNKDCALKDNIWPLWATLRRLKTHHWWFGEVLQIGIG